MRVFPRKATTAWKTTAALILLAACASDSTPPGLPSIFEIAISLAEPSLSVGQTTQAYATLSDSAGRSITVEGEPVEWASSNPGVATISATKGTVTAVGPGTSTISATAQGKVATTDVTVTSNSSGAVKSVSVSLGSATLSVGGSTQATATAKDADGNAIPEQSITWNTSDANIARVDASGVVSGEAQGTATIMATADGMTGTASVTITSGVPTQIAIATQPAPVAQDDAAFTPQPAVQLRNAAGDDVRRSGVTVTASLASGDAGTLNGTRAMNTDDNGVARFKDLKISGAGRHKIRFSSPGLDTATSSTVTIGAGAPTSLAITTQPSASAAAGVAFGQQPVVQLRDASNNPVSQEGVAVTATIASGGGTLGGANSATTNASGVATFSNLSIGGSVGNRTLQFAAPSLTSVTSATTLISAGSPSKLAIATQPSSTAQSGVAFTVQPAVRVQDSWNNSVNQSGVTVTVSLATGSGTLGGTLTATTNASGVATFSNLGITGSGSHSLRFVAAGLSAVTAGTIAVASSNATATQLAITTQPSSTITAGAPFAQQPVVQARDASGNAVSQAGIVVSAVIASGGGTLGGTSTATTDGSGAARFSSLSISGSAGTRTIRFTAPALGSVTSNGLTIPGSGGGATALMKINWSDYANFDALKADCTVFDCSNDHFGDSGTDVTLDPSQPAPDGTQTLRYHYRHTGTGCNTITLSRDFRFPGGQLLTEAWAEFQVRWSTNFTTGGQVPAHSCDPNDHKLIFGLVDSPSGSAGRWAFYVGADSDPAHNLNQERPYPLWGGAQLNMNPPGAEDLWRSGTWHTVRLHLKNSTTASSGDGAWEVWLDGKLIHQNLGFNVYDNGSSTPLKIRGFSLGRNKDDGPPNVDEYLWWGPVTVYTGNPGW